MNQLIAQNLAKTYKNKKIVKNISLYLKSGEIVGLLGPNGAGKTTTFYMLVGIIFQNKGKIIINNKDISFYSIYKRAKKGITYLPQESSIFRKLTVYNNLMSILEIRKDLSKKEKKNTINHLMKDFKISHLKNCLGQSLSGGERRKVEIARALTTNPKFVLLDEPFSGIDPISILNLKKIIKKLKDNGIGILISDHNVRETLEICQRAYVVNNGILIAEGKPKNILKNKKVRKFYLGKKFNFDK